MSQFAQASSSVRLELVRNTVSARQQMATTIRYIREQCNRYNRIELASETKSLMRVMESVGQIARQMEAEG